MPGPWSPEGVPAGHEWRGREERGRNDDPHWIRRTGLGHWARGRARGQHEVGSDTGKSARFVTRRSSTVFARASAARGTGDRPRREPGPTPETPGSALFVGDSGSVADVERSLDRRRGTGGERGLVAPRRDVKRLVPPFGPADPVLRLARLQIPGHAVETLGPRPVERAQRESRAGL